MDITNFINSRDIREYHRKIEYRYNAVEAAWIVYWCRHATLAEKHAAWKWIIDTLPDVTLPDYSDYDYLDGKTVHQILSEYIDLQNIYISEFKREYKNSYFTYTRPSKWINGVFTSFNHEGAFSSFHRCVLYALEHVDFTKTNYIVIRLGKISSIESQWYNGEIFINSKGEIIDVDPDYTQEEKMNEFSYFFERCCLDLPVPFKCGDIVCIEDELQEYLKPIVLMDVFVHHESVPEDLYVFSDHMREVDMCIAGYAVEDTRQCGVYLFWNYMDVEYYRDELKGYNRILKPLSDCLKGLR